MIVGVKNESARIDCEQTVKLAAGKMTGGLCEIVRRCSLAQKKDLSFMQQSHPTPTHTQTKKCPVDRAITGETLAAVAATETGAGAPSTETEATVTGTVIATAMPAITVTQETIEIPVT